jgi:hypothetical protein
VCAFSEPGRTYHTSSELRRFDPKACTEITKLHEKSDQPLESFCDFSAGFWIKPAERRRALIGSPWF